LRKTTFVRYQLKLAALNHTIKLLDECINNEDFKDFLYEVEIPEISSIEEKIEHICAVYHCDNELLEEICQKLLDEDLDIEIILHDEMTIIRNSIQTIFDKTMNRFKELLES